jgi:hypothetical protein
MDARVDDAPQLRSLRIGEIFDRATTFYVRNFVVFTLITLSLEAPTTIASYLIVGSRTYTSLFQQLAHPGSMSKYSPLVGTALAATLLLGCIAVILLAYVYNAAAFGVEDLYAGTRPAYASVFRRVFARALPILGTVLLCLAIFVGFYIAAFLLVLILGLFFASGVAHRSEGIVVFIVFGIICLAAVVMFFALVFIGCAFALFATALEKRSPGSAISTGFGRIFARREIGKAILMTLAFTALQLVLAIVSGGVALLLVQIPVVGIVINLAFSTIANSVVRAFLAVLVAVYYFDVRTRAEGLDLEVDLARLSPTV